MSSEKQYGTFAATSLELGKRATDLANKIHLLIIAEAWLDLAERTTQLERETDEAHRIIEQPLISTTFPRHRQEVD